MDSPEVNISQEEPVKKQKGVLRWLGAFTMFAGSIIGTACGNTPSEQQGVQFGQNVNTRNAADAQRATDSKKAEEIRKQVNQALDQNNKPFAER